MAVVWKVGQSSTLGRMGGASEKCSVWGGRKGDQRASSHISASSRRIWRHRNASEGIALHEGALHYIRTHEVACSHWTISKRISSKTSASRHMRDMRTHHFTS